MPIGFGCGVVSKFSLLKRTLALTPTSSAETAMVMRKHPNNTIIRQYNAKSFLCVFIILIDDAHLSCGHD
jgi:hypothetical protein